MEGFSVTSTNSIGTQRKRTRWRNGRRKRAKRGGGERGGGAGRVGGMGLWGGGEGRQGKSNDSVKRSKKKPDDKQRAGLGPPVALKQMSSN